MPGDKQLSARRDWFVTFVQVLIAMMFAGGFVGAIFVVGIAVQPFIR